MMNTQAQLLGQQLTFSSFMPTQPTPTIEIEQASEVRNNEIRHIKEEIGEKQERISELRKQLNNDEEALLDAPDYEVDIKLGESEDPFDTTAPMLGKVEVGAQYEIEEEIRYIDFEIEELEARLK